MDGIEKFIEHYRSDRPEVKARALELILRQTDRRLTPVLLDAYDRIGGQRALVEPWCGLPTPSWSSR